jgi:hypothetical protein
MVQLGREDEFLAVGVDREWLEMMRLAHFAARGPDELAWRKTDKEQELL